MTEDFKMIKIEERRKSSRRDRVFAAEEILCKRYREGRRKKRGLGKNLVKNAAKDSRRNNQALLAT